LSVPVAIAARVGVVIDILVPRMSAYSAYGVDTYRIMSHETLPTIHQLSFMVAGRKGLTLGTALLPNPSRCFHRVGLVE